MALQYFNNYQLSVVGDALDIAEDMTSNYFKLSLLQWKKNRFDIRTLSSLFGEEIKDNVFALLKKYTSDDKARIESPNKRCEFYLIYLQDHYILQALQRDSNIKLLPLLAYILTHELVHIVRFFKFQVQFDTQEENNRIEEEKIVNTTTYEILKQLSLPHLSYVLGFYTPERIDIDICMV
jgi:hypothetical protein